MDGRILKRKLLKIGKIATKFMGVMNSYLLTENVMITTFAFCSGIVQ